MTAVFIAPTEIILSVLAPPKYDKHVQDWRWHLQMVNLDPNYLDAIAKRQADKRAAGIGTEGLCVA